MRYLIVVATAAALVGCGIIDHNDDAQTKAQNSLSMYGACVVKNPQTPANCEELRLAYLAAAHAASVGAQPGAVIMPASPPPTENTTTDTNSYHARGFPPVALGPH